MSLEQHLVQDEDDGIADGQPTVSVRSLRAL